jgi:hypothetical protein
VSELPVIEYGFFCEQIRVEASGQITPIGIWGETYLVREAVPLIIPSLALHVFVRNPGRQALRCTVTLSAHGQTAPLVMEAPIISHPEATSQNLNFNMAWVELRAYGEVAANVSINTVPPVTRQFRLRVARHPEAAGGVAPGAAN